MNRRFEALIHLVVVYMLAVGVLFLLNHIGRVGASVQGEFKRGVLEVLFASDNVLGAFIILSVMGLLYITYSSRNR